MKRIIMSGLAVLALAGPAVAVAQPLPYSRGGAPSGNKFAADKARTPDPYSRGGQPHGNKFAAPVKAR